MTIWSHILELLRWRSQPTQREPELPVDVGMLRLEADELRRQNIRLRQELADLRQRTIPQLESQIEVLDHEKELLAKLHERELATIEADIAVQNLRIVEAQIEPPDEHDRYRSLLRKLNQ